MNRLIAVAACALGATVSACAHDVITTKITWSREISRLVYQRCFGCHRPGGAAFALITYQDARPWAKAIKEETLERRMPPWGAVKGFGDLRNDQALSMEELELISAWVEGGAPEGDPQLLPPVPAAPPPAPTNPAAAEYKLENGKPLPRAVIALGIRPDTAPPGASAKVVAELPSGPAAPLLWLYSYNPALRNVYYFRKPLALPAGSRIEWSGQASFCLLISTPRRAR